MAIMTAEQAREAAKGLTFEDVWAALMRTEAQQLKTDEQLRKTDEQLRKTDEQQKKTDAAIEKMSAKVDALSDNIGGVNNSLGKWVEEMVYPNLWFKFDAYGYEFKQGCRRKKFTENRQTVAETDIFLENGDCAMPVETKTTLTEEDVDDYLESMEKIRHYLDRQGDKRFLVGAVAGAIVPESVRKYAQKKGLYVLVRAGNSVEVAAVPEGFKARKW